MTWNNVPKPSAGSYTNVNPLGKIQYDQADIAYDDPNMFYDGFDPNMWSDINKPTTNNWINVSKPT